MDHDDITAFPSHIAQFLIMIYSQLCRCTVYLQGCIVAATCSVRETIIPRKEQIGCNEQM